MNRKQIKKTTKRLLRKFGLGDWELNLTWDEKGSPASVKVKPEYRKIYIRFNPDYLQIDEQETRRVILHEVLHVALSPYTHAAEHLASKRGRRLLTDIEERLVTDLESAKVFKNI